MPTTERGEKRVGQLTQATAVDPATKIPGEQGTKAVYFTGKQLTDFVSDGVQNQADEIAQEAANKTKSDLQELVQQAQSAASTATTAKNNANTYKNNANTYQQNAKKYMEAIQNFGVSAALVGDADEFSVDKTVNADGSVSLVFNLLKGDPGGQPIPIKQASKMTDQTKLYLYMGSETNYKNGWVYGYTDGAWTALMTYGNGITVDSAMSSTSTNPVQNKVVNTAIAAKYTKPSSGIPKTDLASAVKTSLGKADTAYQKPSTGIPETDLAEDVKTKLNSATGKTMANVTLTVDGWSSITTNLYQQKITLDSVKGDDSQAIFVDLWGTQNEARISDAEISAWRDVMKYRIYQSAGKLTFCASSKPTVAINLNVAIFD